MGFRFKGDRVVIEGRNNIVVPQPLPESPAHGYFCIDSADNKFKVWSQTKSRWIVLGTVETKKSGESVNVSTETINFNNGVIVTDNEDGSINVDVVFEEAYEADLDTLGFGRSGTTTDAFMNTFDNLPSNQSPEVMGYNMEIRKITFSNKIVPDDVVIKLYKYDPITGGNETLIYTSPSISSKTYVSPQFSVTIGQGYGLSAKVTATGNDKPNDSKVLVWLRKAAT